MKSWLPIPAVLVLAAPAFAADALVIEKLDGPATPAELQAFKAHMREFPAPTSNLHNAMVYGGGGVAVEALGRMVEATGDRELLDRMIAFTDRMLAARNDLRTGAIVWTGDRELVWPNREPVGGAPVYSATENGDVVGHVAYAAKLMLEDEALRDAEVAGGDPFGFGATYHERAVRYVRELDRTCDTFLLEHFVVPDSRRYYFPDSPSFLPTPVPGAPRRPVPWNQQAMLNNGFQRLAECHDILGDDPDRVRLYDAIVQASVDWFFDCVERVVVDGHDCYRWAYVPENPVRHVEDAGHGSADIAGLCRAYRSGRYGITAEMMRPFADTVLHVMLQPDGGFVPRVDGSRKERDHPPGGLRAPWLDLCEFAPELVPLIHDVNRGRITSSPDLVAVLLWHRQRRADAAREPAAP